MGNSRWYRFSDAKNFRSLFLLNCDLRFVDSLVVGARMLNFSQFRPDGVSGLKFRKLRFCLFTDIQFNIFGYKQQPQLTWFLVGVELLDEGSHSSPFEQIIAEKSRPPRKVPILMSTAEIILFLHPNMPQYRKHQFECVLLSNYRPCSLVPNVRLIESLLTTFNDFWTKFFTSSRINHEKCTHEYHLDKMILRKQERHSFN